MQKLTSFLEKSVQWVALGIAGVFLLLCVYWYLLTPIATAKVGGKVVAPGDVDQMTQGGPIADIAGDIKRGQTDQIAVDNLVDPWKKDIGNTTPVQIATGWVDGFTGTTIVEGPDKGIRTDLVDAIAQLPKAAPVSVQAGLSVADPLKGPAGQDIPGSTPTDILWASAAFSIPAKDIKAAFEKPLEKKDPDFTKFYRSAFLSVELQRQQAIGHDATGAPVFPADDSFTRVEIPKVNQNDIQPLPDAKAAQETKNSFAQWADSNDLNVRQPKFYTIHAGTTYAPAVLIGQPVAPAAGAPGAPAAPAPAAPAAPIRPAPGLANNLLNNNNNAKQAGIDPLTLTTDQLVWAHDDTVQAGRSYRYRVVYHMKNPVFGLQNIADPKIIEQLDIVSPPSDWSTPITVPPNVQYWVTALPRNGTAQVDYFKWTNGNWKETKSMSLSPGDTIPETDQTIVDIHNTSSPRPKEQYVLLTDSTGEPIRHIAKEDREDKKLKDLQAAASPDAAPAGAAAKPAAGAPATIPPRNGAAAPRGNR